jgi:lipopolysaccharide/colanic/teichoic acid biosynthesis glycosyltransferase
VIIAILIALLALPFCIPIAIAIRLGSPGGVFFRQWRTGLYGRRLQIYKFRTMVRDAEERKASLQHLNRHGAGSPDFKIVDDPRVTAVGRFLRRTSLDELPNLINVITGDMSIIGPRPTSFGLDRYEDWHLVRLTVPPGMTGLWQISGRSEVDFDGRVKLDYQYIQDQSFALDLKILAKTPRVVFEKRGAC